MLVRDHISLLKTVHSSGILIRLCHPSEILHAGATRISISVKDGGVKYLQIQDNGHGVKVHVLTRKTYETLNFPEKHIR